MHREFHLLAESALLTAANRKAAYYLRAAEFFMANTDPQRLRVRSKFVALVRSYYGHERFEQHRVPYIDGLVKGLLPAYRFTPPDAKGVIVFFGGFDSYIEELFKFFFCWRDAGARSVSSRLKLDALTITVEWTVEPIGASVRFPARRCVGLSCVVRI